MLLGGSEQGAEPQISSHMMHVRGILCLTSLADSLYGPREWLRTVVWGRGRSSHFSR